MGHCVLHAGDIFCTEEVLLLSLTQSVLPTREEEKESLRRPGRRYQCVAERKGPGLPQSRTCQQLPPGTPCWVTGH